MKVKSVIALLAGTVAAIGITLAVLFGTGVVNFGEAATADSSKGSAAASTASPEATEEKTEKATEKPKVPKELWDSEGEDVDCDDPYIRTDVWLENCNEGGENPNAEVDCTDPLALCDENGEPIETVDTPQEYDVGDTFKVGEFEVTVHDVELDVQQLRPFGWETYEEDYGYSWEEDAEYPQLGQFVVATITAKNVGIAPATFSTDASTMYDSQGREFAPYSYYQETLDWEQQPDQSAEGLLVWDVPTTVTGVSHLMINPDAYMDSLVVPAIVNVS